MVAALAVVVAIGVAYTLMLPAITMENQLACGMSEHIHTEDCYAEADGERVLVCGLNEHVHNELCLAVVQAPEVTEDTSPAYVHQHDSSCYVNGVLVCTLEATGQSEPGFVPDGKQEEFVMDPAAADPMQMNTEKANPGEKAEKPEGAPEETEEDENLEVLAADPSPAIDLRAEQGVTVDFTLTVRNKEVKPQRFYGNGEYKLVIDGAHMVSYTNAPMTYFITLDTNGYTLNAGNGTSNVSRLEDFTEANPGSTPEVFYWAVRDAAGYYTIYIQPKVGAGVVYTVTMEGSANSNRSLDEIETSKSSNWNPSQFAFDYSIETKIPGYANFPDQTYSIVDQTVISNVVYSPFNAQSRGTNLTLTYRIGSQPEHVLLPIEQAVNDPTAHLAYYQDGDELILMNRTTHGGECMTVPPVDTYSGWCACWEQEDDTIIRITYLDTYARQHYVALANVDIVNTVSVTDQNNRGVMSQVHNKVPNVLDKQFHPGSNNQCEIVINEHVYDENHQILPKNDLSVFSSVTITDTMNNATYAGGLTITREGANQVAVQLVEGVDYTTTATLGASSFTVKLLRPGPYRYSILYDVEKPELPNGQLNDLPSSNVVDLQLDNVRFTDTEELYFNYSTSSRAYGCEISFSKYYENGNPVEGAEFGLFDENGVLLARSYTTADGQRMVERVYVAPDSWGVSEYALDADLDRVIFTNDAGLRSGQLFYIQETQAPEGYLIDSAKHYFFITSHPGEPNPVTPITQVNGQPVLVLDNWTQAPNHLIQTYRYYLAYDFNVLFENWKYYELPETGGPGELPFVILGGFLLLIPCAYLLRKRRARHSSIS